MTKLFGNFSNSFKDSYINSSSSSVKKYSWNSFRNWNKYFFKKSTRNLSRNCYRKSTGNSFRNVSKQLVSVNQVKILPKIPTGVHSEIPSGFFPFPENSQAFSAVYVSKNFFMDFFGKFRNISRKFSQKKTFEISREFFLGYQGISSGIFTETSSEIRQ